MFQVATINDSCLIKDLLYTKQLPSGGSGWIILSVGIGKILKAVQSFYIDSMACVRVANDGLRQGCVISSCLFHVYMDGVVREMNVRVLGKGLELLSAKYQV